MIHGSHSQRKAKTSIFTQVYNLKTAAGSHLQGWAMEEDLSRVLGALTDFLKMLGMIEWITGVQGWRSGESGDLHPTKVSRVQLPDSASNVD